MNFVLLCLVFIYPADIRRWWGKSVLGGRAAYTKTLGQEMLGCILQVEELSVVRTRKARRDSGIRCSWDQGLGEGKPGIMHPHELCQEGLAIIRISLALDGVWHFSFEFIHFHCECLCSYLWLLMWAASFLVFYIQENVPHRVWVLLLARAGSSGPLGADEVSLGLPKPSPQGGALSSWLPGMRRWLWIMLSFWTVCTRMIG